MSIQKTSSTVDIKDYLLDKKPAEYVQAASPYHVLFQNASDFIISRKKGRAEKELVVLISEGLFYFKEKENVEEITQERLKTFLRDLRDFHVTLDQVLWLPKLCKNSISRLINIISNPTFIDMARARVLTEGAGIYDNWRTDYWKKSHELYEQVHITASAMQSCNYRTCMDVAFEIHSRYDNREALYFVDTLRKSNFKEFSCLYDRYSYSHTDNKLKASSNCLMIRTTWICAAL